MGSFLSSILILPYFLGVRSCAAKLMTKEYAHVVNLESPRKPERLSRTCIVESCAKSYARQRMSEAFHSGNFLWRYTIAALIREFRNASMVSSLRKPRSCIHSALLLV